MRKFLPIFLLLSALASTAAAQAPLTVVNAASFEAAFPVAPGGLATAFGAFTGAPALPGATAPGLPWPTTLANTRVLVSGVAAPLYFVSAQQINFQVPQATGFGRVDVVVEVNGSVVASGTVDVLELSPGIFELGPRPNPQGAIRNQDDSVNGPDSRAARGEVIQIFGTGQGPLETPVADGNAPDPPSRSVRKPRVYIQAVELADEEVTFSGVSGYPGLWQINAVVPNLPFIAGQVPLVVVIDNVPSNPTTFWVKE